MSVVLQQVEGDNHSDSDEMGPAVTLKEPIDLQRLQDGQDTEFEILEEGTAQGQWPQ